MKITLKSLALIVFAFAFSSLIAANAATNSTFSSVPTATNAQQKQAIHLVETYYNGLNKKDMKLFFSTMSDNVAHDINQGTTEKGLDKFKTFMDDANNSFDEKLSNIIIMISKDGKHAAAQWLDTGTYVKDFPEMDIAAKNQKYTLTGGHFFEINGGKISRVTTYFNETDFMNQIKNQ